MDFSQPVCVDGFQTLYQAATALNFLLLMSSRFRRPELRVLDRLQSRLDQTGMSAAMLSTDARFEQFDKLRRAWTLKDESFLLPLLCILIAIGFPASALPSCTEVAERSGPAVFPLGGIAGLLVAVGLFVPVLLVSIQGLQRHARIRSMARTLPR